MIGCEKLVNGVRFILILDVAEEKSYINVSCMKEKMKITNPLTLSKHKGEEFIPLYLAIKICSNSDEKEILDDLLKTANECFKESKQNTWGL